MLCALQLIQRALAATVGVWIVDIASCTDQNQTVGLSTRTVPTVRKWLQLVWNALGVTAVDCLCRSCIRWIWVGDVRRLGWPGTGCILINILFCLSIIAGRGSHHHPTHQSTLVDADCHKDDKQGMKDLYRTARIGMSEKANAFQHCHTVMTAHTHHAHTVNSAITCISSCALKPISPSCSSVA